MKKEYNAGDQVEWSKEDNFQKRTDIEKGSMDEIIQETKPSNTFFGKLNDKFYNFCHDKVYTEEGFKKAVYIGVGLIAGLYAISEMQELTKDAPKEYNFPIPKNGLNDTYKSNQSIDSKVANYTI